MRKIIIIVAISLGVIVLGSYKFMPKDVPLGAVSSFIECEAAGYPVGESYPRQCWTPDGGHFVEEIEEEQIIGEVSLTGEITCLPKRGIGPQTLECAIGLKASDGRYYGLRNLFNFDPTYQYTQSGMKVEVSGILLREGMEGPDGNSYDIAGVIELTSIRKAN